MFFSLIQELSKILKEKYNWSLNLFNTNIILNINKYTNIIY